MARPIISPSNLHRRERCPGSFAAEAALPPEEKEKDEVAGRGNRIHSAVSQGLLEPSKRLSLLADCDDPDIVRACWIEAETCWNSLTDEQRGRAKVIIERFVNLEETLGIPGGTPDYAILVTGTDTEDGFGIFRDWKSGGGWVAPARWNLQLYSYAVGLMAEYGIDGHADIGVFQPLVRPYVDNCIATKSELASVRDKIKTVISNCSKKNAPIVPGGHCTYCRAKDKCEKRLAVAVEVKQIADPVETIKALEAEARREFYGRLKAAEKIMKDAIEQVETAFKKGAFEIPGYCVGEGNKKRSWNMTNAEAIDFLSVLAIKKGLTPDEIREPISVAAAEKLFGEEEIGNHVLITFGNPTVKKAKK